MLVASIAADAFAAQVTLAWDPNTESDLAGYKLHYGTASGSYTVHLDIHNVTSYTVTGLTEGQTYYFAATAYDASGCESGYSNQVSYTVPAANAAPSIPATPTGPSSAAVNAAATFSTSASDPNNDTLTYRYDWGGGVIGNWGAASQSHTWTAAGHYGIKTQARDSRGAESAWSGGKTVIIIAIPQNQAPMADAGANQTVNSGAAVSLRGSGSDPENAVAAYRWRQTSGATVSLSNAESAQAGFTAPTLTTGTARLVFELQVTDAGGLTATDSVWVTVQPVAAGGKAPGSTLAPPDDPDDGADAGKSVSDDNDGGGVGLEEPAPDAPRLVAPVNDSVVNAAVILQTGPFTSLAAGAKHAQTRWQVYRDEDDACLLDIRSTSALTRFNVPKLVLDEGTPFFWRAQFIDSHGTASAWSDYETFSTQTTETDLNANGIPDAQEVPAAVDLDKDGVADSRQARVKSVKMEGTAVQIGVSIKESSTALAIESVESEDPQAPGLWASGKPASMPFGILNVKIAVAKPGDPAMVKLYFPEPVPAAGKWYEYYPSTDRWVDFSFFTEFASDRLSATIALRDGGSGDADGVANGIIIDPGGIGLVDDGSAGVSADSSGSGGGGGCFIDAVNGTGMDRVGLGALVFCAIMSWYRRTAAHPDREGV
jgi:fibronectin type 3 domain-containing protein